ncbi:MAG: hypothetical protein ACRD2C_04600 [Acidimicrobiales bacterium]
MFDGTRSDLDGTTILCIIEDDTDTHERLLAVHRSSLQVLDPSADHPAPTTTVRGPLAAWMDLLIHAAARNPTPPDGLLLHGDATAFGRLINALH